MRPAQKVMDAGYVASHKQACSLMRDIFEEIFENQPLDPEESARRSMRPNLRARFYEEAAAGDPEFALAFDGMQALGRA